MDKIVVTRRNFGIIRRSFLHLTLEHVAECCGLTASTVRNAELGRPVRANTITKLVNFYVDALIDRINLHKEIQKLVQQRSN